jgi:tetratricopeptide (TPR) repeat protein
MASVSAAKSASSTVTAVLLAGAVACIPVARGGVDPAVEALGAGLALAALFAAFRNSSEMPVAAFGLASVIGAMAFQLIPLPPGLHLISPQAERLFRLSLGGWGAYPASRAISLDPPGTAHALAKAIACTAAFVAAWRCSGIRRARERIVHALAMAGVLVAGTVLGAALVGAGELLAPRFPFVNPNHLAGFLNLTSFIALGLAFRARGQVRVLWALAFLGTAGVIFISLSRAGIGAFFVGSATFLALHRFGRAAQREAHHRFRAALIVAVLTGGLGVGALLGLEPMLAELGTLRGIATDLKIRLLSPALSMVRDFPVFGTGPGAFETVFLAYQTETATLRFTHVENEWIQPILDLGLPVGVTLIAAFAWTWLGAARKRDASPTSIGIVAGTAALVAHNTFDFSLEILGVALPFSVAMGVLARDQKPVRVPRWTLAVGMVSAVALCTASLWLAQVHDLERDRDRVQQARPASETANAARRALSWHPADWMPHATAGVRIAAEAGCEEAIPWLVRAMLLDPLAPAPHLSVARCLAGRNDRAAKREYRLAVLYGIPALSEAARQYSELPDLLEIAPVTPDGLLALGEVLADFERPNDAAIVLKRLIDEFADKRAFLPLARAKASLGDHPDAVEWARRHEQEYPRDAAGWLAAAGSLEALGRGDDAAAEIQRGLAAAPGSPGLLAFLAERSMKARRWSEAKRLAEEIAPRTVAEVTAKQLLAARALAGQGRVSEALERARSAAAAGETLVAWEWVSLLALEIRHFDEAAEALRHAATLPGAPEDAYASRLLDIEKARTADRARAMTRDAGRASAPGDHR